MTSTDARALRSHRWGRARVVVPILLMVLLALPLGTAGASTRRGASGETVKLGMINAITGTTSANPNTDDAFLAAIKAFNKRGGAGVNGSKLEGVVCDTHNDANAEVDCARQMQDQGVVATINDLAFNNPAGVVDVMEAAGIARIGLLPTNIDEFGSSVSFPISAGAIAAYIGDALAFADAGHKRVALVRTDAPTGATFRGFVEPLFEAAGVKIVGDIALATGATDYAPYVSQIKRTKANAVLLSVGADAATQLIAAMAQLNYKVQMGGNPGTFDLDTMKKYKDITKETVLVESFPYPSSNNAKKFPALKQYLGDMKASGKEGLQPKKIKSTSFNPWIGVLAFVRVTANLETFTAASVLDALRTAQDVDLDGLTPPWTPSTPGFSVFKSSSNHFIFISKFDGKRVVTKNEPIDITQYTGP